MTKLNLTDDVCGRKGCSKAVANGMQCQHCSKWFHANCTGLTDDLYSNMDNKGMPFACMACRVSQENARVLSTKQDASTETQDLEPTIAVDKISQLMDLMLSIQKEANERYQTIIDEMRDIKLSLPSHAAANKTLELSKQAIIDASNDLTDQKTREVRVIFWGDFSEDIDVNKISSSILSYAFVDSSKPTFTANRLYSKGSLITKGILVTLPSKEHATKTLDQAAQLKKAFPFVRGVAPDRPLKLRREYQGRQQPCMKDKLLMSPRVILTPLPLSNAENLSQNPCSPEKLYPVANHSVTVADGCTQEDVDSQSDMEVCSEEFTWKTKSKKTKKLREVAKPQPRQVCTMSKHTPTRQAPRLQPQTYSSWSTPIKVGSTDSVFHSTRRTKPPNIQRPAINRPRQQSSAVTQGHPVWKRTPSNSQTQSVNTRQISLTTGLRHAQSLTYRPPHYPTNALLPTPTTVHPLPPSSGTHPYLQAALHTRFVPMQTQRSHNQWFRPVTNWSSNVYTRTA